MAHTLNWTIPQPLLDIVFTPPFANELSESKTARDEIGFAKAILQKAPHHLRVSLQSCPSSMADFLSSLKPILSQRTLSQIADNARFFDLLCEGKIADNLIANISFAGWLIQLADTVAARYMDTTSASTTSGSSRAQSVSSSQILGTVSSHTSRSDTYRSSGMGFDRAGDEPDEKIVQVDLTGPSITTAWKNNSTVVKRQYNTNYTLLKLETTYALPRDKTPADAGSYDVFHGTNRHLTGLPDWPDTWHARALNLRGADQACQMNPMGVRVVYTSFSPLRAFLWAAFQDHIYRNVPGTTDREFMSTIWTTQGKTYRGVAVFAFSTATPTPSGRLSHVTLPKDKSAEFSARVNQMTRAEHSHDEAWAQLRSVAGSLLTMWPDLMHSVESGDQAALLSPFRVNQWRTCWLEGAGVQKLNESYNYTMAIAFTYVPIPKPVAPPTTATSTKQPPRKDDERKDKDQESKGKKGSPFKSLRNKLYNFSLRGSGKA